MLLSVLLFVVVISLVLAARCPQTKVVVTSIKDRLYPIEQASGMLGCDPELSLKHCAQDDKHEISLAISAIVKDALCFIVASLGPVGH